MVYAATLADVQAARQRIRRHAHVTPVLTSRTFDDWAGRQLFFKCENMQRVGAFKFRGAMNAVAALTVAQAARGVVTHSSGNHAQALALAARVRGIQAHIVMPSDAPPVKRRAVLGYGARVVSCEPDLAARESTAAAVLAETGGVLIHPYDNAFVIAGAGTVALELLEQVPDLDAVIAPVGGGGLLSGIALALREAAPHVRVFAGEPKMADDAFRSKQAGHFVPQTNPQTLADGLKTSLGELTWPVIRDCVEAIHTVSEARIVQITRDVWERLKIVIEPSSAVPVAAVLSPEFRALEGIQRIGIVLSGGNVDLTQLPWL
jgi:threonine dehydratase/serine racemase